MFDFYKVQLQSYLLSSEGNTFVLTTHSIISYVFRKGQIYNLLSFFRVMMNLSDLDQQFYLDQEGCLQKPLLFHYM